jgi:glutamate/tyrosine decarboxylase-like PLP-dependent enzyme
MRRTEDMHVFSANYDIYALPKRHMPKHGMPPKVAQQGITDLRQLDANPRCEQQGSTAGNKRVYKERHWHAALCTDTRVSGFAVLGGRGAW